VTVEPEIAIDSPLPDAEVLPEDEVHVEPRATWTRSLLAGLGAGDSHVTADEIFEILHADTDERGADLCAAARITLPRYCVWKTKYGRLTVDELRRARRREQLRIRLAVAALSTATVAAIVMVAVVVVSRFPRAAQSSVARAADPPLKMTEAALLPARALVLPPVPLPTAGVPSLVPPVELAAAAPPAEIDARTESGYTVQVAAAPTEREARAIVERLTAAGHSAYVSRAAVRNSDVFRVRVGPFEARADAQDAAERLHRDGYAGAWVAR